MSFLFNAEKYEGWDGDGHEAVGEGRSPQAGYHRLSSRPVGGHQGHQLGDVHKALGTYNFMSILCTVGTKGYYNFDILSQQIE